MFFALFEIGRRLFQLLPEMIGLVFSFLGLVEGALRYLLGLLEPFFKINLLSRSLSQGSSGGNWARKVKSEKVTT